MTIKEYFRKKQPINDEIIGDTCRYKKVSTIKIQLDDNRYAAIKIAHVGENLWALGYAMKPYSTRPVICRDCTTHAITKGYIENLIYGMMRVLILHLEKRRDTKTLIDAIRDVVPEALEHYKFDAAPVGKITL